MFLLLAAAAAIVCVLVVTPPTSAQNAPALAPLKIVAAKPGETGPLSATQKRALSQGYLVPNQQAYENAKAQAAQKAAQSTGQQAPSQSSLATQIKAPTTVRSFQGLSDPAYTPSDSTGAVGPSRYIELVNSKFGIYNKTSNKPIASGTLNGLVGESRSAFVFDPQVIWDPTTHRFYYAMDDVRSASDNRLAFGFSKTASPSSGGSADWCKYQITGYGSQFPDYPKLGDTSDLILIGDNVFNSNNDYFSDLNSVEKPPAGTGCPEPTSLVRDRASVAGFTPVPANQTDSNSTGYVVDTPDSTSSMLTVYPVSRNPATGGMNLGSPSNVTVPAYTLPVNAQQRGTNKRLDTLDARLTQAVSAVDPSHGDQTALWTQHMVMGGAGAQVRWYEIAPTLPTPLQSGTQTNPSRYIFNGAISPDRQVNATTSRFGDNMVLGFNSSSSTRYPDIRTVSKQGASPTSGEVLIKPSRHSLTGFDCSPGFPCRWGDYAAATPDPSVASTATRGRVWLASQWARSQGTANSSGWGTWIWSATP